MSQPDGHWPLDEAKEWLRERVREGARCPCCTQMAKVYRRKINKSQAAGLIVVWQHAQHEFVHFAKMKDHPFVAIGGEMSKLRFWGLIEADKDRRPDGGKSGWWRVTELGRRFVHREVSVPKYALLYDNRLLGIEGDGVLIDDCLGKEFNYAELMAGV